MSQFPLIGSFRHDGPVHRLRLHPHLPLLAALNPVGAQILVWAWEPGGGLRPLVLPGALGSLEANRSPAWSDLAWHPTQPQLLVTSGVGSQLWDFGEQAQPRLLPAPSGVANGRWDIVGLGAGGGCVWGGATGREESEVRRLSDGGLLGSLWRCDTQILAHPEGELLASLQSDQGATLVRFAALGGVEPRTFDRGLILDCDGYEGLQFSPTGDRLLYTGNAYERLVTVHAFPSLKKIATIPLGSWHELRAALPPTKWECKWANAEIGAFAPSGDTVFVGHQGGEIAEMDVRSSGFESVGHTQAHATAVGAMAVSSSHQVLASADVTGELKLFQLPHRPASADATARPLTHQYLAEARPVAPDIDPDDLKLTDGRNEWNMEEISEEMLPANAPTWARIAADRRTIRGK